MLSETVLIELVDWSAGAIVWVKAKGRPRFLSLPFSRVSSKTEAKRNDDARAVDTSQVFLIISRKGNAGSLGTQVTLKVRQISFYKLNSPHGSNFAGGI